MCAGTHDELLGALFIKPRHFNEFFNGEVAQVVERLHAAGNELIGKIVVHAFERKHLGISLAKVFFSGNGISKQLVAGALTKLFDRFMVESFDREEFLFRHIGDFLHRREAFVNQHIRGSLIDVKALHELFADAVHFGSALFAGFLSRQNVDLPTGEF